MSGMSKKRPVSTEQAAPTKLTVEPENMIVLRAAGGKLFLIDRNCALVSRRCQRDIQEKERALLYGAVSIASSTSRVASAAERSESIAASMSEGISAAGGTDKEALGGLLAQPILYACFDPFADVRQPSPVSPFATDCLLWLTVGDVLTRQPQARLQMAVDVHMPSITSSLTGSRRSSPGFGSTGVNRPPLLTYVELATGARVYPVVDLPDVSAELLEIGIRFMYVKYQADSDAEKRSAPFSADFVQGMSTAQLMATSMLLAM